MSITIVPSGQSQPIANENSVRRLACPMLTDTDIAIVTRIDANIRKIAEKIQPVTDWVKPVRRELIVALRVTRPESRLAS